MRKLAILFAICLIFVIVLADFGIMNRILRIVNDVPYLDKILHFLLIGGMTYVGAFGLIETFPDRNPNWLILFVVVTLGFVFTLEELSQGPIRGRDASWSDLGANYAGILCFGFLARQRLKKLTGN